MGTGSRPASHRNSLVQIGSPTSGARRYTYKPLPPLYIRTLELIPPSKIPLSRYPRATTKPPLACRVVHHRIDDPDRPFEALSYVWGDPTPADEIICLDDTDEEGSSAGAIGIGANLASALRAFRPRDKGEHDFEYYQYGPGAGKSGGEVGNIHPQTDGEYVSRHEDDSELAGSHLCRVWVDALCINQQDMRERQSQVRLMGKVFGTATRVLCWLSSFDRPMTLEEDEATAQEMNRPDVARLAIGFLREVLADPETALEQGRQALLYHEGDDDGDEAYPDDDGRDKAHPDDEGDDGQGASNKDAAKRLRPPGPLLHHHSTEGSVAHIRAKWKAIKALFDLRYFHRAWIIQEVGLAQDARMYWGSPSIWLSWSEAAKFARLLDDDGAALVSILSLKSWVANHINLVWLMKEDDEDDNASGGSRKPMLEHTPIFNFVEVLHWARVHQSTDPRDYIYALLSHPSAAVPADAPRDFLDSLGTADDAAADRAVDGRRLLVQPDYSISTAQCYTGVAVNVVRATCSLHVLAFVDHGEGSPDPADYLPT